MGRPNGIIESIKALRAGIAWDDSFTGEQVRDMLEGVICRYTSEKTVGGKKIVIAGKQEIKELPFTAEQCRFVEATLINDETSTDEELIEFFKENDIPQNVIDLAISQRTEAQTQINFRLHG